MGRSVGLYHLAVQQDIAPAPDGFPGAVDWLPLFAGFSWLAYGAQGAVVITMAPSPSNTGEAAVGGFCRQVLSLDYRYTGEMGLDHVKRVCWAPNGVSIGTLAAAAGEHIHVFVPKSFGDSGSDRAPEIPLTWVKSQVLDHAHDVFSFSWSESGDGLLSVGPEIVMWHKEKECWSRLWRFSMEQPQSLSAASWSARGIAASADAVCSTMTEKQDGDADHMVRIWWWWEDGKELQEIELLHPHHIVSIQWRPMRGFGSSTTAFRPVLLTCCRDGVVRLWAEIGDLGLAESLHTSRASLEPAVNSNDAGVSESQLKLAFFVSAVIDVNSALKGDLGKDIYVSWPEARGGLKSAQGGRDDSGTLGSKESEEARNEWVIGIGPSGSVALWSVQSVDDLSPARGPLIQLWHQRSGLLPVPSLSFPKSETVLEGERNLGAVKVVIHRPHGALWGPPSSLDVFEVWSPHLLRWSCVWPPAEAIGGPSSRITTLNRGSLSTSTTVGKLSAWGVSSEVVDLSGHSRNIVQVAVHPSAHVMLVASLDDHGTIILWDTSDSFFNPRLETIGSVSPQWKICGQLHDKRLNCTTLFNSIAWAPLALQGGDAILFTGSSAGVNCFLISKNVFSSRGKPRSFSISYNLLLAFEWPLSIGGHGPTGLYTLPSNVTCNFNSEIRSCILVGVGDDQQKLVSWKLDIDVAKGSMDKQDLYGAGGQNKPDLYGEHSDGAESGIEDPGQSDDTDTSRVEEALDMSSCDTKIKVSFLGFAELNTWQHVTSISVETSARLSESHRFCDVVAGCADGVVRLWKVWNGSPAKSVNLMENHAAWQCVGVVKVGSGPVIKVAFCGAASKLACVAQSYDEAEAVVQIWGVNLLVEEIGFCLDRKVEVAPGPSVSLCWFDGGIGLPVLGVANQFDIQLFSESRESKVELTGDEKSASINKTLWTTLASSPRNGFRTGILSWDLQGTLIVTCGRHILLYSDCVESMSSSSKTFSRLDTSQGATGGSIRPQSFYETFNRKGMRNSAESKVLANSVYGPGNEIGFKNILRAAETIGSPLLDYHPTSLMSWMSGGRREYARASVRHLASCLISLSSFSSVENRNRDYTGDLNYVEPKVPHVPLNKIFQVKEQFSSLGQQSSWSLIPEGNVQPNHVGGPEDFSSSSTSSFLGISRNDTIRGQSSATTSIKAGGLIMCTKVEVEAITNAVRDSVKIPGLTEPEKLQLLSIIDVLAEMDGVTQASQVDSIDLPGQRLWLAVRYAFHFAKWRKEQMPNAEVPPVESKIVAWALQSDSKETLCSLCLPDQSMTWPAMRAVGLGFWLTDGTELRTKMEKLARAQFLQTRNPKDCALLYIALDRRHVLSGLFKLSKDPKDKPLADFLLRDFKDEKHQSAALKNAYVLMGKHRHELAAAFFILGGDNNSAAVVCAKNLGDVQLALVICSLLEGVNGPVGRDIIVKYALPNARRAGDVWLASLLQWLLGEGIQCIQELDCSDLHSSPQYATSTLGALKGSPLFPLDPDVGNYCTLLVSKPRLRTEAAAARASDMARIAASQSAAALIKSGLYLQALDYVGNSRYVNLGAGFGNDHTLSTFGGTFPHRGAAPPENISDLEIGSGWVSMDIVAGLHSTLRLNLAIRCASQLLQDHPQWGGRHSNAWQDPVIPAISSKFTETLSKVRQAGEETSKGDSSSDSVDQNGFIQEADISYATDIRLLQTKYVLKVDEIITPSITLSQAHYRPYLCHRSLQGLRSFLEAPDTGFHLASQLSVSELSAQFLEICGVEAPRALARVVLSCGGGANAPASQDVQNVGIIPGRDIEIEEFTAAQNDARLSLLLEELVRFGGEILRLAKAASCKSPLFSKETGSRAMKLLSFVFFVSAAWLGRQIEPLHELISPTVTDPSTSPTVPPKDCDAVLWFRRLDLAKASLRTSASIARGKRPLETGGINIAGTVTISTNDAWRVLGVSLWTHLLIYVKKQLSGIASEAVYNSLGRMPLAQSQNFVKTSLKGVAPQNLPSSNTKASTFLGFETAALSSTWLDIKSKVRESYYHTYQTVPESNYIQRVEGELNMSKLSPDDERLTSATDFDDFGAGLLSAITSIVAGLRKQLAAHFENTVERSEPDPLILWLWGKPSPTSVQYPTSGGSGMSNFFGASASSGQARAPAASGASSTSRGQSVIYPTVRLETQNVLWRELWEILVVREKICSALGLEGVNGQRLEKQNDNISGWYLGRKARALTPQSSLDRGGASVTGNGKRPPKRIMWNAVHGVSPASDQGVILSSKRDETMLSRPRASKEGLRLSEEFSEGTLKRG